MLIHCLVQNDKGMPLAGATVNALDASGVVVETGITNAEGKVVFDRDGVINLEVFPPKWEEAASDIQYLPSKKRLPGTPRPSVNDVVVELADAVPVKLRAYDLDGKPLSSAVKSSQLNPAQASCFDLQDLPASGVIHWSKHDACPYLLLPQNGARKLALLWTAPGYGRIVCWADNGGRGFTACEANDGIFLNRELALTAWQRLTKEQAAAERGGYTLSSSTQDQIAQAQAAIEAIADTSEERQQAMLADKALGICLQAGEQLVFERAQQRIQRHRNKPRTIAVGEQFGKDAAPGMTVRYRQLTHDFKFGVFVNPDTHPIQRVPLSSSVLWERLREMGINLLPIPLLWSLLEAERGNRQDDKIYDRFPASELREAGFHLKDHISIWFWQGRYPDQWGAFMPDWLYELSPAEILEAVYEHKSRIVEKFSPHIQDWQAINEAMLSHTNGVNLTLDETVAVVETVIRAVRERVPNAVIEVNNCQVFGEGIHPAVQEQGYELVPDQFYEILLERGVDFDVIGMQMYYGGYMDSELFSGGFPIRHPWDIEAIIKRYTRLGKPIRITEISVPSSYPSP
ncbi:MAG: endo-1,4-beta-xylanase, partial [Limnochordia bacterium]